MSHPISFKSAPESAPSASSAAPATVGRWMTPSPRCISRDEPLSAAHKTMREGALRHLPVVDGKKLVGIVSEGDLFFVRSVPGIDLEKIKIGDAMTENVYTARPETPLREVVATMAERRLGCVIVTRGEELLGVFTVTDAMHVLEGLLKNQAS
jgi:acetoin utilization protein AcuB